MHAILGLALTISTMFRKWPQRAGSRECIPHLYGAMDTSSSQQRRLMLRSRCLLILKFNMNVLHVWPANQLCSVQTANARPNLSTKDTLSSYGIEETISFTFSCRSTQPATYVEIRMLLHSNTTRAGCKLPPEGPWPYHCKTMEKMKMQRLCPELLVL